MIMIVAGTGHRPNKLGGNTLAAGETWTKVAISWLATNKPQKVISGMAQGWDQYLAGAAISLGIPLIAAIPFSGQEQMWSSNAQDLYNWMLKASTEVKIVSEGGYAAWKMQKRNMWMVDQLVDTDDILLACWNGTVGGTANCVAYAQRKKKNIVNLFPPGGGIS